MKILRNRTVKNAGWLIAGRIIHMLLSFVIGLLTARCLGPSNFGLINYAGAYVTFFTAFCTLGINAVIVKNLIDHPTEEGETVGTTIVLRLVSSFLSLLTIVGIVSVIDHDEPVAIVVVALYCISLLFQVFDTFSYWFQSKLLSKYYAIATTLSFAIASVYRAVLLFNGNSVEYFAVANSVDYCVMAVMLYVFYRIQHGPKLSFSIRKAKELLSVSVSYILSGLMVAVYGATDKLMLKQMLSEAAVGYYSLAVSVSVMWTFLLSAIIDSMKPTIMRYHNVNRAMYEKHNRLLYALIFYISLFASLGITLLAPLVVNILYGDAYAPAIGAVRIVVWYVAFSYLGVARDTWIVCERKQKYLKYIYLSSALINVALNFLLIPVFGVEGAAMATVVTQISTVFVVPLLFKDFRPNVKLIVEAIMLKGLIRKRTPDAKGSAAEKSSGESIIVTAGSAYLDIDAYACSVAMSELLGLKGKKAIAFSDAPCNYSVCAFLVTDHRMKTTLPDGFSAEKADYIIVDVSDPDYIKDRVPLENVIEVYDHHTGFEEYWTSRIGENAHIEFIGAAATLIYREWKNAGCADNMSKSTALLLIAAILDNTLNLTSSNTTDEDIQAYNELCAKAGVGADWRGYYFSEVQKSIEADLKNALFNDMKIIRDSTVLPQNMAQLCIWDAERIIEKLPEIREWFKDFPGGWMINIIDIGRHCGYFVCDDNNIQKQFERMFDVRFEKGIAVSAVPYLRKEIIKTVNSN